MKFYRLYLGKSAHWRFGGAVDYASAALYVGLWQFHAVWKERP